LLASALGYREIVELLFTEGANVNAVNVNGETALILASDGGMRAILRKHIKSQEPIIPEDFCYDARIGDLASIKNDLKSGIDVNARGREGITALIEASLEDRRDIVGLLIAKGAEVDARTDYGLTALMGASREGHVETVKMLLQKGAQGNLKNHYGETALEIAGMMGHKEIVELLTQWTLRQNRPPETEHENAVSIQAATEQQETGPDKKSAAMVITEKAAEESQRPEAAPNSTRTGVESQEQTKELPPFAPKKLVLPLEANALKVTNKAEDDIDNLVQKLRDYPNITLVVKGFVSSEHESPENTSLSQKRADSVRDILIGKGISATRIQAKGMGIQEPVASNKTLSGRAQNRRVEIIVLE
jgi:outer membrane protein OmpA-like peptidoglycan-associated protein